MDVKQLAEDISVCGQISPDDLEALAKAGFKTVINNRPDNESADQPAREAIEAKAKALGLTIHYLPMPTGAPPSASILEGFNAIFEQAEKPVLAYCRSGNRSGQIYQGAMALKAAGADQDDSGKKKVTTKKTAGKAAASKTAAPASSNAAKPKAAKPAADIAHYTVVIVGGGTAGISVAQSLLKRDAGLKMAIIEPSRTHDYQAAWTLVGAGEFEQEATRRAVADLIPAGVRWIREAAAEFDPENNQVVLADGKRVAYQTLIVCPGLKLNWAAIEGLEDALGKGGVTSNYRYDLAPYTWDLVKGFNGGDAIFTQPAMPIKCAGAPQKAMYLSCSHWEKTGILTHSKVKFFNAGGALFGVADFVPPLMEYVKRYNAQLMFNHNLVKINGVDHIATFECKDADGKVSTIEQHYDMIHVVPPQCAPDFVAQSPLAAASGWVDVDPATLQHVRYPNVFSLGDAGSMPNAKTTAAVRKQAPIVADNLLAFLHGRTPQPQYDGYGACPLTVEKGKILLAEFGYGGKLLPTFPLDPLLARRWNWFLKKFVFPRVYWDGALKGREWLTSCGDKK